MFNLHQDTSQVIATAVSWQNGIPFHPVHIYHFSAANSFATSSEWYAALGVMARRLDTKYDAHV